MQTIDTHIEAQNTEMQPEWREQILNRLERLQQHYPERILHARAEVVASPRHRHGAVEVRLVVQVPGATVTVAQEGDFVPPLIHHAFDALRRRMDDRSQIIHTEVHPHESAVLHGTIAKVLASQGYGFIRDHDEDVYFGVNAVKDVDLRALHPGQAVSYGRCEGERGPYATWVRLMH